jgi:hypothetical protein
MYTYTIFQNQGFVMEACTRAGIIFLLTYILARESLTIVERDILSKMLELNAAASEEAYPAHTIVGEKPQWKKR